MILKSVNSRYHQKLTPHDSVLSSTSTAATAAAAGAIAIAIATATATLIIGAQGCEIWKIRGSAKFFPLVKILADQEFEEEEEECEATP